MATTTRAGLWHILGVALAASVALPKTARAQDPLAPDLAGPFTIAGDAVAVGRFDGSAELRETGAPGPVRAYAVAGVVTLHGPAQDADIRGTITVPASGDGSADLDLVPRGGAPAQRLAGRFASDRDALGATLELAGGAGRARLVRVERPGTVIIKAMTLNIHGMWIDYPTRAGPMAALVREERPDVVALQEVNGFSRTSALQARVFAALTGYDAAFRGARRYGPFGMIWAGTAVLARRRVLAIEDRMLPQRAGSFPRNVLLARCEIRPGIALTVLDTHLHQKGGAAANAERVDQAQAILDWIDARSERPLLFAGDLNADPTADPIALLTGGAASARAGNLRDAWADAHPEGGGESNSDATRRIDYILAAPADPSALPATVPADLAARGGVRVLASWLRGDRATDGRARPISDHRAVLATLEIARDR